MLFFNREESGNEVAELSKSKTYEEFTEKFKPKKTTDDCYTLPLIYQAVKEWAIKEYSLEGREIVRPFYPGGDYEKYHYPDNCVVIDNPPFSIFSKILAFYDEHNIQYLLFAPHLTMFNTNKKEYIVTGSSIVYENGAIVNTSFITNLEDCRFRTAPDLCKAIQDAVKKSRPSKHLQKYQYPDNVITTTRIAPQEYIKVPTDETYFIQGLEQQRERKKKIFGGGYLVSDRFAVALKKMKKREDAILWGLSEKERKIIEKLNK